MNWILAGIIFGMIVFIPLAYYFGLVLKQYTHFFKSIGKLLYFTSWVGMLLYIILHSVGVFT